MAWMKRSMAPKFWKIPRKRLKFVVCPKPGAHRTKNCIPLGVLLRDYFGFAETMKEAKSILKKGFVKVNGLIKKDHRFSIGFTDIVEIGNDKFIVTVDKKGLIPLETKENKKLCKIVNKKTIKGGKIQIIFHDGRTMLAEKDYKTNDVVVFDIVSRSIVDHIPFEKGNLAMICGGQNRGRVGKIKEIITTKSGQPNKVVIEINGNQTIVRIDYVFVIGKEKPLLSVFENENA